MLSRQAIKLQWILGASVLVSPFCFGQSVLYRINAGGPALSAGDGSSPSWSEDSESHPSAFSNHSATETAIRGVSCVTDRSIPPHVPLEGGQAERYGAMHWQFPIAEGLEVEVRLVFAEMYEGITGPGQRVFDVRVEGALSLDNLDVYAEAGANTAMMKRIAAVCGSDGILNIDFDPVVENPLVNAIEIVSRCAMSTPAWQNNQMQLQSGQFWMTYKASPNAGNIDGLVALSSGPGTLYSDSAVLVRFNVNGYIDAYDGTGYRADTTVPYAAGALYRFRVRVDVPAHHYRVTVSGSDRIEHTIAVNHAFRSTQATITSLNNWAVQCGSGSHQVCQVDFVPELVDTLATIPVGLPYKGFVAWADFDNDNDLDLAYSRLESYPAVYTTHLYRNDSGVFVEKPSSIATGGHLSWCDYDNDGDMDLAIASTPSRLYRNDGSGTFTDSGLILPAGEWIAWGDSDNDGHYDLAVGGSGTRICHNVAGGFITTEVVLPDIDGPPAWGDYDNDQDLDLALTSIPWSTVYANNADGTFSDIQAYLPGGNLGSAIVWGDYDNDGYLDLALGGFNFTDFEFLEVHRNNQDMALGTEHSSLRDTTRLWRGETWTTTAHQSWPAWGSLVTTVILKMRTVERGSTVLIRAADLLD